MTPQNGKDLLVHLENLKPQINDIHERWAANGNDDDDDEDYEQQARFEEHRRKEARRLAAVDQARAQDEDMYRRRDAEERERTYRRKQEEREREARELDEARIAKDQARQARQRQAEEYQKAAKKRDDEIRGQRRAKEDVFSYVNQAAGSDYAARSSFDRGREGREPSGPRPMPPSNPVVTYSVAPPSAGISYVTPPNTNSDLGFSSPGPLPLESPNHIQYRDPINEGDMYEGNGTRQQRR